MPSPSRNKQMKQMQKAALRKRVRAHLRVPIDPGELSAKDRERFMIEDDVEDDEEYDDGQTE